VRSLLLWLALVFCLLFGAATASVASQSGVDIFTLVSFLIIVMIMLAVLGAIRNPPRR
jgi:hypothetical protein